MSGIRNNLKFRSVEFCFFARFMLGRNNIIIVIIIKRILITYDQMRRFQTERKSDVEFRQTTCVLYYIITITLGINTYYIITFGYTYLGRGRFKDRQTPYSMLPVTAVTRTVTLIITPTWFFSIFVFRNARLYQVKRKNARNKITLLLNCKIIIKQAHNNF